MFLLPVQSADRGRFGESVRGREVSGLPLRQEVCSMLELTVMVICSVAFLALYVVLTALRLLDKSLGKKAKHSKKA